MKSSLASCSCGVLVLFSVATGCSSPPEDNRLDQRVDIPPAPENGVQYIMPEMDYAPYTDQMSCVYFKSPDHDVWVTAMEPFQNNGHHLVAFTSETSLPDGTVEDCTDPIGMGTWRPLSPALERFEMPDGYATKIAANTQLIFQVHYINYGSQPIVVRDVYNFEFADEGSNPTPASSWASGSIDYMIPANEEFTLRYGCDVPFEMNGFLLFGHMHEWGDRYNIDLIPSGGTAETIYDVPTWTPEMRDTPPVLEWDTADPLALKPGDRLEISCTWNNNTSDPMYFPTEMCASVLWYYPGDQPLICAGEAM